MSKLDELIDMNFQELQVIGILTILIIFVIWALCMIIDQLTPGDTDVKIPDQFWALLTVVIGSLLYSLRKGRNGKNGKSDNESGGSSSTE